MWSSECQNWIKSFERGNEYDSTIEDRISLPYETTTSCCFEEFCHLLHGAPTCVIILFYFIPTVLTTCNYAIRFTNNFMGWVYFWFMHMQNHVLLMAILIWYNIDTFGLSK
jgi:hypothetical protein